MPRSNLPYMEKQDLVRWGSRGRHLKQKSGTAHVTANTRCDISRYTYATSLGHVALGQSKTTSVQWRRGNGRSSRAPTRLRSSSRLISDQLFSSHFNSSATVVEVEVEPALRETHSESTDGESVNTEVIQTLWPFRCRESQTLGLRNTQQLPHVSPPHPAPHPPSRCSELEGCKKKYQTKMMVCKKNVNTALCKIIFRFSRRPGEMKNREVIRISHNTAEHQLVAFCPWMQH